MRVLLLAVLFGISSSLTLAMAQVKPAPQTARQGLIEMFFGTTPDHVEKHLPEKTRNTLKNLDTAQGMSVLDEFTMFAAGAKMNGKFETFETGPILLRAENPNGSTKIEVGVERDDLIGDKDEIEVSLRITQQDKEQKLPFVPRFTFVMKSDADLWRLNEINFNIKVPLADPDFLKSLVDQQRAQNEEMAIWSVHEIVYAETAYSKAQASFACSLAGLADPTKTPDHRTYLYDRQLIEWKKRGYAYAISGCDVSHYKVAAAPATPDSGSRAFCADESGTLRASADGKPTTCLSSGAVVEEPHLSGQVGNTSPTYARPGLGGSAPKQTVPIQRVRVSAGVMQGVRTSYVAPVYPHQAKAARVQGAVVLAAVIGKDGSVESLRVVSSASPLLDVAAFDAVKQWKYRPYILNGEAVQVDTTITVNFLLAPPPAPSEGAE